MRGLNIPARSAATPSGALRPAGQLRAAHGKKNLLGYGRPGSGG